VGEAAEVAALHGHSACTLSAEREHAWPQRAQSRLCQPLVGIDLVEPAAPEIEDHGSRHDGDVAEIPSAQATLLQAALHGGDGFLAVGRAARKDDRVREGIAVAVAQCVGVDGSRAAAANIDSDRCAILEANDGEPRRAFLVGAGSDFQCRPVEFQGRTVEPRIRLKHALVGVR
jgi:hypothetical protein